MQATFPTIINLDGFKCVATLWNNVPGKERIYLATESGKDMGYYDLRSSDVVITRSTWNAKGHKEGFEKAFRESFVPQIVVELETAPAPFTAETKTCWECGSKFTYAECKRNDGDWNLNGGYCGC